MINHNSDTNKVFAELIKAYGVKFNDKPNFKIHEESSYIDFTCFDCVIRDHHDEVLIEQPINLTGGGGGGDDGR